MAQAVPIIAAVAGSVTTGVFQAQAQKRSESRAAAQLRDAQAKATAELEKRKKALKARQGFASTILTDSLGAQAAPTGTPTSILGGTA